MSGERSLSSLPTYLFFLISSPFEQSHSSLLQPVIVHALPSMRFMPSFAPLRALPRV